MNNSKEQGIMIEFMLLAAPRSGTTWAANWLTTDTTLCLHDPLYTRHYTELDSYPTKKRLGISCTGLMCFPEWVNAHPARKIVLHRNINEIRESLKEIGLPWSDHPPNLDAIKAIHLPWTDLFEHPKFIYETLLELPFDPERHSLLKDIKMQPNFEGLSIGHDVTRRLVNELLEIMVSRPEIREGIRNNPNLLEQNEQRKTDISL